MTEVLRIVVVGAWLTWASAVCALPASSQIAHEPAASAPPLGAQSLYLSLRSVGLDRKRVYSVRDASFNRGSLHISLDEGTIAFSQDVMGRITGACFQGDGEVLLIPPNQVERSSLALFTGSAILEERFTTAYFRFNDDTFSELQPALAPADNGSQFVDEWDTTAQNLAQADALRLLVTFSRFLPEKDGGSSSAASKDERFLHARVQGRNLGAFDLYYDSRAADQIWAGQLKTVKGDSYYDVWTAFSPNRTATHDEKSLTSATGEDNSAGVAGISEYKIRAEVRPPSHLNATAELQVDVRTGGERTLLFQLSRALHIERVEAGGQPIEFVQNPALEGTQLARRGNDLVAVVFPEPLQPGQKFQLRFVYGGDVLSAAGPGLLYVGARGMWYPNRGLEMANFDLQFSYPPGWTLVATGKRVENADGSSAPGAQQISHWISERPIPLAGFNLGKYSRAVARAGNVTVETYATATVERNFPQPAAKAVATDLPTLPGTPPGQRQQIVDLPPPPPSPARNAQPVADRSAEAIEFFASRFGPYPFAQLELTQMPGPLSQGWPGLIFLSSWSFLSRPQQLQLHLSDTDSTLSDSVVVHETAHQWWGDLITWSGYRDQWLIEALANYSAVMLLEKNDPAKFRALMDKYRDDLLRKNKDGVPLMDAGPVTLGNRLSSSHFPDGYDAISYGRGTWLLHMLRTMMRDAATTDRSQRTGGPEQEPFLRALRKFRQKYEGKSVTSAELLHAFEDELPPAAWYEGNKSLNWFYNGWVNGTSIPAFELSGTKYSHKSGSTMVSGTIKQKSGSPELVTSVPIYAVVGQGNSVLLGRVFVEGEGSAFHFAAPAGTRKVVLDPNATVLSRKP